MRKAVFLLAAALLHCGQRPACDFTDFSCNPLSMLAFSPPWMAVAVGSNCQGWYSLNARTWTPFTFPGCTTGTVSSVTYGAGRFVAVGSTDGTTCGIWSSAAVFAPQWERQSCGPTNLRMTAVAFGTSPGGSEFVAAGVASGGTFVAVSSADGTTWSDATITEGGAVGAVLSLVFWETGGQFLESSGTPQNTRRRSVGGGTNWIDGDGTGTANPKLALGPTVSGNRRILNAGNSPTVIQYGDNGYSLAPTNYSPNIFGGALPVMNDMVYGEGKREVFVRDTCGVTVSTSDSGADNSGSYTMTACSGSNLKAVGYVEPYFIAGADDGYFYYSASGLPAEWTRSSLTTASVTQKIAGRSGL